MINCAITHNREDLNKIVCRKSWIRYVCGQYYGFFSEEKISLLLKNNDSYVAHYFFNDNITVDITNGNIEFYKNDLYHRENYPAEITKLQHVYWLNGLVHNPNGPAYLKDIAYQKYIKTTYYLQQYYYNKNTYFLLIL